jgi:hypothetical protein
MKFPSLQSLNLTLFHPLLSDNEIKKPPEIKDVRGFQLKMTINLSLFNWLAGYVSVHLTFFKFSTLWNVQ